MHSTGTLLSQYKVIDRHSNVICIYSYAQLGTLKEVSKVSMSMYIDLVSYVCYYICSYSVLSSGSVEGRTERDGPGDR